MENTGTTSCQVAVPTSVWVRFRQLALAEGVSAAAKVRELIVAAVSSSDVGVHESESVDRELKGVKNE